MLRGQDTHCAKRTAPQLPRTFRIAAAHCANKQLGAARPDSRGLHRPLAIAVTYVTLEVRGVAPGQHRSADHVRAGSWLSPAAHSRPSRSTTTMASRLPRVPQASSCKPRASESFSDRWVRRSCMTPLSPISVDGQVFHPADQGHSAGTPTRSRDGSLALSRCRSHWPLQEFTR